jgi:hypothetical protein
MPALQRSVLLVTLLTLIISSGLCLFVLARHGGDAVAFAYEGTMFTDLVDGRHNPDGTIGYDGQFVYYIARDGFAATPFVDSPSFRFQRIFYPLLGRALALGNPALVPWSLLLINVVAHAAGAGLLAALLVRHKAPVLLAALVYALWIGVLLSVRLTLTEVLCFALGMGALLLYERQGRLWAVIALLLCATLTKELGLIFAGALALHAFASGRRGRALLLGGLPLAGLVAWWAALRVIFGSLPTDVPAAQGISLLPFGGLLAAEADTAELAMLVMWLALPTLLLLALALWRLWRTRALTLALALVIAAAGFVFTIPAVSWSDPVAAYRVATPIVIGGLLFVAEAYPRRLAWLAAWWLTPLAILPLLPGLWG